jgi:hypothetical protein
MRDQRFPSRIASPAPGRAGESSAHDNWRCVALKTWREMPGQLRGRARNCGCTNCRWSYVTTGPEQLSDETGLLVYMAQSAHLGEYMNRQIPVVVGPASYGRDDVVARRALIERATKKS